MKIGIQALLFLGIQSSLSSTTTTTTTLAFSPSSNIISINASSKTSSKTLLQLQPKHYNHNENVKKNQTSNIFSSLLHENVKNIMTTATMAAAIWVSPLMLIHPDVGVTSNQMIHNNFVADAKEMASGSGSRVNKDPESLLRYGLPIPKDKEVRYVYIIIIIIVVVVVHIIIIVYIYSML